MLRCHGERLRIGADNFTIIGVIEDFHFKPIQAEIGPLIIILPTPYRSRFMFMRIHSDAISQTLKHIEGALKKISPDFPFEFIFWMKTSIDCKRQNSGQGL